MTKTNGETFTVSTNTMKSLKKVRTSSQIYHTHPFYLPVI
jgi:hypothetical protein